MFEVPQMGRALWRTWVSKKVRTTQTLSQGTPPGKGGGIGLPGRLRGRTDQGVEHDISHNKVAVRAARSNMLFSRANNWQVDLQI